MDVSLKRGSTDITQPGDGARRSVRRRASESSRPATLEESLTPETFAATVTAMAQAAKEPMGARPAAGSGSQRGGRLPGGGGSSGDGGSSGGCGTGGSQSGASTVPSSDGGGS